MQFSTMKITRHDQVVLRTMLGLTQENVSYLINKNRSYVGHLETGYKPITSNIDNDLKRAFALTEEVHEAVRVVSEKLREQENNK